MKKQFTKILSMLLAILMLMTMFPLSAFAEDNILSYLTYEIINGEVTITGCDESISGDVVIPDKIEGYPVTVIGNGAFAFSDNITSIIISENVKTIGSLAFQQCKSLTSVTIPESVIRIESEAFRHCNNLARIKIPDSITYIGFHAFSSTAYYNDKNNWENDVLYIGKHLINAKCSGNYIVKDGTLTIASYAFASCHELADVVLPDSVKNIGSGAFYYSSLANIIIPESVVSIGDSSFEECYKLTGIIVDENNNYYASDEYGVLFNKNKTIIIRYPMNNGLTAYTIPESVISINRDAFSYCDSLLSITVPESVVNMEVCAFYNCGNLKNITISDSVKNIGASAFRYCNNLTEVYYTGTEANWNEISIGNNNEELLNSTIYFNHHIHSYNNVIILPTCTEQGYTTYTCECGDSFVADYVEEKGHSYTSSITTPATHLTTGVMTYTCGNCEDTYTEVIDKTPEHTYNSIVTAPTCTAQGFTTYTCKCGDSYVADYVNANGHSHTSEITTPATHTTEGIMTYTCACGDSYTETIDKLTDHTYKAVITAPTCTQKGFTTYTCACGDTYVADYVDATDHSHTSEITTPATHTTEGIMTYTCECGDSYAENIAKLGEHTYNANVTAPTCTEQGYTTYTCSCGDSYTGDFTEVINHSDKDGNNVCDDCESSTKKDTTSLASSFFKNFIESFRAFLMKIVAFFSCKY